jgi:hypothetical protein
VGWLLVRLLLGETPIGGFGQITSGGTDGDGVVVDPYSVYNLAAWTAYGEKGKVFVCVATELIIRVEHLAPPVQ